jgi:hypothetical protein
MMLLWLLPPPPPRAVFVSSMPDSSRPQILVDIAMREDKRMPTGAPDGLTLRSSRERSLNRHLAAVACAAAAAGTAATTATVCVLVPLRPLQI